MKIYLLLMIVLMKIYLLLMIVLMIIYNTKDIKILSYNELYSSKTTINQLKNLIKIIQNDKSYNILKNIALTGNKIILQNKVEEYYEYLYEKSNLIYSPNKQNTSQ